METETLETAYCQICKRPRKVIEVHDETDYTGTTERFWKVTDLACGHELAYQRGEDMAGF